MKQHLSPGKRSKTALVLTVVVFLLRQFFGVDVDPGEIEPLINTVLDGLVAVGGALTALFAIIKGERIESALRGG